MTLSESHRKMLFVESSIAETVAEDRGYETVTDPAHLRELGFGASQICVPGLLIPIYGVDGLLVHHQYRPDGPRIGDNGKAIKYETLAGRGLRIDVPLVTYAALRDPQTPLWITEGSKKADSAASRDLCCVALMGVWGFVGTNEAGGKCELSDWRAIALNGRTVYIAFDSDVMTKSSVYAALVELARMLDRKGAKPRFVLIPAAEGEKVGLDDWFASGGTAEALIENCSDTPPGGDPDKAEVERLAELPPLQRDRELKASAKRMGVGLVTLRKLVESAVKEEGRDETLQGKEICFEAVEPWHEPVNGSEVLTAIASEISKYMALPTYAAQALALWVAHTYVFECFPWSPKIGIISPEKRCGKSNLISILMLLVPKALGTDSISTAALFRVISEYHPTVFMDEADAYSKDNEDLRQMLNSSSQRSKVVIRCVGENFVARSFEVYGPLCYGMIGEPWDTVADRSIMIRLKRKPKTSKVKRLKLRDAEKNLVILARKICRFALEIQSELESSRPAEPAGLDDRAFDIWEPLFAIADAAGGMWPSMSREAAICLSGAKEGDQQPKGLRLLLDIRQVFVGDKMASVDLCEALCNIEESVWAECRRGGKSINPAHLAKLLKPYDVKSSSVRIGDSTPKGYTRSDFEDPFSRYLPDIPATPQHSEIFGINPTSRNIEEPGEVYDDVAEHLDASAASATSRNMERSQPEQSETSRNDKSSPVAVLRFDEEVAEEKEFF